MELAAAKAALLPPLRAVVKSNMARLAVVGVVNSVLSAYYYLRVLRTMYQVPPTSEDRMPSASL